MRHCNDSSPYKVPATMSDKDIESVRLPQKKVNDFEYLQPKAETATEVIFGIMGQCPLDYIHTTEPALNDPEFFAVLVSDKIQ